MRVCDAAGDMDDMPCKRCGGTLDHRGYQKGSGFIDAPRIDPRWFTTDVLGLLATVKGKESGWYCKNCGGECGTADFWCYCGDKASRVKSEAIPPDRSPFTMNVLADALMDAGCDDGELLDHVRTGPHVSGCWCVDLLTKGQT